MRARSTALAAALGAALALAACGGSGKPSTTPTATTPSGAGAINLTAADVPGLITVSPAITLNGTAEAARCAGLPGAVASASPSFAEPGGSDPWLTQSAVLHLPSAAGAPALLAALGGRKGEECLAVAAFSGGTDPALLHATPLAAPIPLGPGALALALQVRFTLHRPTISTADFYAFSAGSDVTVLLAAGVGHLPPPAGQVRRLLAVLHQRAASAAAR